MVLHIKHSARITTQCAMVDGTLFSTTQAEDPAKFLTQLYKELACQYPKYYKMDPLSRLGFIASELLTHAEHTQAGTLEPGMPQAQALHHRGVICFNRSASLVNDTLYQHTIQDPAQFFASPAIFVYTLPNIVTGEIAIRNKYYGETSFFVTEQFDPQQICQVVADSFMDNAKQQSVMCGWVECSGADCYDAVLLIVDREEGPRRFTPQELEALYQI